MIFAYKARILTLPQIGNTDTGGDDIRIQGPNPNFTLYDSTAVADGVAAYTGGVNFYGQKTNTAYHLYSAIRPRIINGLDSDTAKTGALHFGVSDGASAAATNIIFKIEPDEVEVAGNIVVSGTVDGRDLQTDGTKLDNIEANADVTDATNVAAAGAAMTSGADFTGDVTIKTSDGAELTLQTSDTTVNINNVLGKLSFNAPDEAGGTDAILEAASIKAVAASTFTSSSNATRLQFSTGNSEAAQIRMTIAPEGTVSVGSISTNAGYNDGTAIMSVGRGTDTFNILAINHSADANNVGQINFVGNTDANSAKIVHAPSAGMMQFYVGDAVGNRILNLHDDTSISAQNGFGVDSNGVIDGHGLTLGDNHKAIFGAGSDLQIYHDGHSYIKDLGAGNLSIMSDGAGILMEKTDGENIAFFDTVNSNVVLFESGIKHLETTSTGVDITGTLTSDGLTVDGTPVRFNSTAPMLYFMEAGVTDQNHRIRQNAGNLHFQKLSDDENTATTNMVIDGNGDISFYEDTGTTAKFFWDASAESLGIGTDSPSSAISASSTVVEIADSNLATLALNNTSASKWEVASAAGDFLT